MFKNVLDCFENKADKYAERPAVTDENTTISYRELKNRAQKLGGALAGMISQRQPVAVYGDKSISVLCAFLGIAYAGGCYTLLNPELPEDRLKTVCTLINSDFILTDDEHFKRASELFCDTKIILISSLLDMPVENSALLVERRRRSIDTDPLYINFTSGSTGVPKGIVVSHRSVMDFISCFTELFDIGDTDVIGNQAPFDFDVSVKDIYSALFTGARLVIIPRRLFSAPTALIDYICENGVTTMIWAVSALSLLKTFHALEYKNPASVRKVLFSGEVMPNKVLNYLRRFLPNALLVNLYGPTEITCNCTYHILTPERDYAEGIPIGIPFPNEDVFLLDDENREITEKDVSGEVCVRGTALALGYYRADDENEKHFTPNPLNGCYPERIYRTGDLAKYDQNGELVFCGRKDFQIKYMGHRIELEEIERRMAQTNGVEQCCCIFDDKKQRLKGYYIGSIDKAELHSILKGSLPAFMVPGILHKLESFPLTKNGNTDRKKLADL